MTKRDPVRASAADLRASVAHALAAAGEEEAHRLSRLGTSVRFVVDDEEVTVLLDRTPPRVGDESEPAEIEIELTQEEAERFRHGDLPLPSLMHDGEIRFAGDARRFLMIHPILRGLLKSSANGKGRLLA